MGKAKRPRVSKLEKQKKDPNSRYWRSKADKAWSSYVRIRDNNCVICGSSWMLQAHHLVSRVVKCLRHDPSNGVTLCCQCHRWDSRCSAHQGSVAFVKRLETVRPEQVSWVMANYKRDESPNYKSAYEKLENLAKGMQ